MTGKQILNYRIIRQIGSGGMATVYEAIHTKLDTKVAIKVLDPLLAANKSIRQRFIQEAKIMASLTHDGITKVIDFDDEGEHLAIVMEYLNGKTLDEYVKQKGQLNEEQAKSLFIPALDAFAYAHKKGIVHRDVKPSNIFITTEGKVKIMDFGIAKLVEDGSKMLTQTGTQMGTPTYMSPEQVHDSKHIDHRTDIYSLGVTLWFMLAGKPPYDADKNSSFDIFMKINSEPLPKLSNNSLFKSILKATEKDKDNRFSNCEEFVSNIKSKNDVRDGTIIMPRSSEYQGYKITNDITEYINEVPIELIFVKGGNFLMGSNNFNKDNQPVHKVTLNNFHISKYPVTQLLWKTVMGNNPSFFNNFNNYPVDNINWFDTQEFIKKLNSITGKNYRLPTEAEWEYAAKGGNKSKGFKYAGSNNNDNVAWYDNNSYDVGKANSNYGTHAVGEKKPNELDIFDMSGNVQEWCNDRYNQSYYDNSIQVNPKGPSLDFYRVLRGGSWSSKINYCNVAVRNSSFPNAKLINTGFRLVY